MSVGDTQTPYIQRPHVWDAWEELYWGLLGYSDEHPGELADLTPIEIYNYAAAHLSITLNRPAPIDEIAAVIAEVWVGVQDSYGAACVMIGRAPADRACLPVILRLEEAWLMVEAEAGASMPPEYRFFRWNSPIISSQ